MSLTHAAAREWIGLMSQGGLDPAQQEELSQHLSTCRSCSAYARQVASYDARLKQVFLDHRPLPAMTKEEIQRKMTGMQPKIQKERTTRAWQGVLRQAAAVVAVLLIVAGISWVFPRLIPRLAAPVPAVMPFGSPTHQGSALPSMSPTGIAAQQPPVINPTPDSGCGQILPSSLVWDPTSSFLVYSTDNGSVWMQSRSSSAVVPIFTLPEDAARAELHPAWSPDGSKLAVYGTWMAGDQSRTGLWVILFSSSGETTRRNVVPPAPVTTPVPQAIGAVNSLSWSPDSKQLTYTNQAEAWVYDLAAGETRQVTGLTQKPLARTKGSEPFDGVQEVAWSPGGDFLALGLSCNCPSPWSGVGIVDAKGGDVRLLADGGNDISWSPAGWVTFRNTTGDWAAGNTYDYYWIEPSGKMVNITRSNPAYDPLLDPADKFKESNYQVADLKWAPDGKFLYQALGFRSDSLSDHSFMVKSDPETYLKEFYSDSREKTWQVFPGWLSNSQVGYFAAEPAYPNLQDESIYQLRTAMVGSDARDTLVPLPKYASAAAWAPDGSAVALLTTKDPTVLPNEVQILSFR